VTGAGEALAAWRGRFRRHERLLALAWLAGSVLLVGVLAWAPARVRLLDGLQGVVDRRLARWPARLAEAEALLAAGRVDAAEAALTRLDRAFPARSVRHGLDQDRERLLLRLGRAREAQNRRGAARAAYQALVAFDSLNYLNHFELGMAEERMGRGWAVPLEARDAFAAALRRFPAHLPSLRGYLAFYLDRGEFQEVAAAYRAYLDAFLIHHVEVAAGDSSRLVPVQADGLPRVVRVALPAAGGDTIALRTRGFAVAVDSVVLTPALAVGQGGRRPPAVLGSPAGLVELMPVEGGGLRALGAGSSAAWRLPDGGPFAVAEFHLRLFKPVDDALWAGVVRSFNNLLDYDGLAAVRARTLTLGPPDAADRALARLPWAREGRRLRPDEHPF
jgi:tetratricopeptide (TPR) repeat protein